MAPKKKVVASKRKRKAQSSAPQEISSGSESYEPPQRCSKCKGKEPVPVVINRFIDVSAKERFDKDFSTRIILCGRWVNFKYFADNGLNLSSYFDYLGWSDFLQIDIRGYDILVSEFYANMKVQNDQSLCSFVKGTEIEISESLLAQVFGFNMDLPFVKFSDFDVQSAMDRLFGEDSMVSFSKLTAVQLPPIARVFHKIIVKAICPRGGKFDSVSAEHLFVIDALLNHTPINLPSLMIKHMRNAVTDSRGLPYGIPLTLLFQYCGIDFTGEPTFVCSHSDRFDEKSLRLMHLVFIDGQLTKMEPFSHSVCAPAQGESLYTTNQLLRSLIESVKALHIKVDLQADKIQEINETMVWLRSYYED